MDHYRALVDELLHDGEDDATRHEVPQAEEMR